MRLRCTRAKAQGDGCAEEGLEAASTNQRRAVEEAARGEAAERAGDIPAATTAYQATLALDVTNALAVAGLARLGQPMPVPPPPAATQPPDPSWWSGPWPYFLGSVLVSAILAGAVLWFVERRMTSGLWTWLDRLEKKLHGLENKLDKLKQEAATADRRLDDMKKSQQSDQVRLSELENHTRTDRALVDQLKKDTAARIQATESALRALRLQKERIDHLTELIDLSAQTQAEPTSEVVVWLEPRSIAGTPANDVASDDERANGTEGGASADGAVSAGDMRVEVKVFAIGIGHGQAVQEQLVVQRVIERAMERDGAGEIDSSVDHRHEVPVTEQGPGPFEKAAADSIVDPVWERVVESWWVQSDYRGLADGAKCVKGVEDGWHDLILGTPAERIALGAGFSPASADVMEAIAEKVRLPGDDLFKGVRRLLQYTGIVLGAVSGTAPLANACVSSLAHDLLAEATAKALRQAVGHVLAPVRSVERPLPATELGPEGARTGQFHSDLVAAAPRQRTHEREAARLEAARLEAARLEAAQLETRWLDGPSLGL